AAGDAAPRRRPRRSPPARTRLRRRPPRPRAAVRRARAALVDDRHWDVAIVGGGIVGLATAMTLARRRGTAVCVLEAESRLAAHQSGHNSGVIHSGLYYRPGSLKARYCVEGREAMYRFCAEHGVAHERCGKIGVATRAREPPAREGLARRSAGNGLAGG